MLVYEKTVDGTRHLYGAPTGIPSNSDEQLTYKDDKGEAISDIADFKLIYGTTQLMKGTKTTLPSSDDEVINVSCGDAIIIGVDACKVTVSVSPKDSGTVAVTGSQEKGSKITLTATAATGYTFTKWDDDETENPREVTLNGDLTIGAVFTANQP